MNRLKELRKEKGLTQKELSEEIAIPLRTLQSWENEESQIKNAKVEMLANYFNVSPAFLLGYSDYKTGSDFMTHYYKQNFESLSFIDSTIEESLLETIGEKNEHFLYDFLLHGYNDKEDKDYSLNQIILSDSLDAFIRLPSNLRKDIIYWSVLSDKERKNIFEIIKSLAFARLDTQHRQHKKSQRKPDNFP